MAENKARLWLTVLQKIKLKVKIPVLFLSSLVSKILIPIAKEIIEKAIYNPNKLAISFLKKI